MPGTPPPAPRGRNSQPGSPEPGVSRVRAAGAGDAEPETVPALRKHTGKQGKGHVGAAGGRGPGERQLGSSQDARLAWNCPARESEKIGKVKSRGAQGLPSPPTPPHQQARACERKAGCEERGVHGLPDPRFLLLHEGTVSVGCWLHRAQGRPRRPAGSGQGGCEGRPGAQGGQQAGCRGGQRPTELLGSHTHPLTSHTLGFRRPAC